MSCNDFKIRRLVKSFFRITIVYCVFIFGLQSACNKALSYGEEITSKVVSATDAANNSPIPSGKIRLHSRAEANEVRKKLIREIYKSSFLPNSQENLRSISLKKIPLFFSEIKSFSSVQMFKIVMNYGVDSQVYFFHPKKEYFSIKKFVIFHEGHVETGWEKVLRTQRQVELLLKSGYSVVLLTMPLYGMNSQPVVDLHPFGRVLLSNHDAFQFLSTKYFNPISFFIEPVQRIVDFISVLFPSSKIFMIGLSGGGWTTTIAAAIIPKIQKSYSVAGSLPLYLRTRLSSRKIGDFEQTNPSLYKIANYLELYVLASIGEGRSHTQVLNKFDSCCLAGEEALSYRDLVRDRVQKLGSGSYSLIIDKSHKHHMISDDIMASIIDELNNF